MKRLILFTAAWLILGSAGSLFHRDQVVERCERGGNAEQLPGNPSRPDTVPRRPGHCSVDLHTQQTTEREDVAGDEVLGAAAIYVFDLLTQNPDRSAASPNCGRAGHRVVPYDFETAFSFRFAVPRVDGWRVAGLPFTKKHLFHGALKRSTVDWRTVFDRFRSVPLASLADACSTLPQAWVEIGQEVLAHLTSVHDHWSEFELETTISLGSSL